MTVEIVIGNKQISKRSYSGSFLKYAAGKHIHLGMDGIHEYIRQLNIRGS